MSSWLCLLSPPLQNYIFWVVFEDFLHSSGVWAVQQQGQSRGYCCKQDIREDLALPRPVKLTVRVSGTHKHVIFTQDFPKVNTASYLLLNSHELSHDAQRLQPQLNPNFIVHMWEKQRPHVSPSLCEQEVWVSWNLWLKGRDLGLLCVSFLRNDAFPWTCQQWDRWVTASRCSLWGLKQQTFHLSINSRTITSLALRACVTRGKKINGNQAMAVFPILYFK